MLRKENRTLIELLLIALTDKVKPHEPAERSALLDSKLKEQSGVCPSDHAAVEGLTRSITMYVLVPVRLVVGACVRQLRQFIRTFHCVAISEVMTV